MQTGLSDPKPQTGQTAVQYGLFHTAIQAVWQSKTASAKPAATKPATACGSAALPTGRDGRLMDGYAKCRESGFQLKQ